MAQILDRTPVEIPETESDTLLREIEAERARLGRELHAGVGQPLAGIKLNLEILDSVASGLPAPAQAALNRLHRLAEEALAQTRALSHQLHPPAWQQLPVGAALRQLLEMSATEERLETSLDLAANLIEPSHSVRLAIYRCTQECLSNVMRHSGANRVEVSLRPTGRGHSSIELTVKDNGNGRVREGNGIGLASMREHAESLGGSVRISGNQQGTTVVVSLPAHVE
jgi:signal transduction histidine kinase